MTDAFAALFRPGPRTVVGLMSGTSLDGVDAAVVRLDGHGRDVQAETLAFVSEPYDAALRDAVRACAEVGTSDVRLVSQLNVRLGERFAEAARAALREARVETPDLVGSHGQTVQHVPVPEDCAGVPTRSTLQIGSPAVLAARLGAPVVSDFRAADVALGGQGAPLAPVLDAALFSSDAEARVLLNLGGVANVTVLPAGEPPSLAFDTGDPRTSSRTRSRSCSPGSPSTATARSRARARPTRRCSRACSPTRFSPPRRPSRPAARRSARRSSSASSPRDPRAPRVCSRPRSRSRRAASQARSGGSRLGRRA